MDELDNVLWAYQTMHRNAMGETPFNLSYGTETVIPLEVNLPSLHVHCFNPDLNSEQLHGNLDLLVEAREAACVRMALYQQKVAHYYNSRVRAKLF